MFGQGHTQDGPGAGDYANGQILRPCRANDRRGAWQNARPGSGTKVAQRSLEVEPRSGYNPELRAEETGAGCMAKECQARGAGSGCLAAADTATEEDLSGGRTTQDKWRHGCISIAEEAADAS